MASPIEQSVGWRAVDGLINEIAKAEEGPGKGEMVASLRTALANLSKVELVKEIGSLDLEILFECLSTESSDQIQSTRDILMDLMTILEPVETLTKYHESILQGLFHPVPEVRTLVVAHLSRCIDNADFSLVNYPDLVIGVINQLVADEIFVAKAAEQFLIKYSKQKPGKEFMMSAQVMEVFKNLLNDHLLSDAKKFRLYESLTNIAVISPEIMNKLDQELHLLKELVNVSFDSSDPLGQMNGLEILSTLVGCPHGLEGLRDAGVLDKVDAIGHDWKNIQLGNLLFPGVLKFIGKIGAIQLPPERMTSIVINTILDSGKDYPLKTVAVEALAFIGVPIEGKRHLKARQEIKQCFENIHDLIEFAPTEFRARALGAMAILFGSDEENEECLPHWFNILFRDVSQLFEMVRLPFPDIRINALNFLAAIAHLEWAQRHYLRGAGVMEFLVSREIEPDIGCVHAKFRLVSIIVDSPSAAKILSPENMARLKLYVKQGPFYTPAEVIVATRGAD